MHLSHKWPSHDASRTWSLSSGLGAASMGQKQLVTLWLTDERPPTRCQAVHIHKFTLLMSSSSCKQAVKKLLEMIFDSPNVQEPCKKPMASRAAVPMLRTATLLQTGKPQSRLSTSTSISSELNICKALLGRSLARLDNLYGSTIPFKEGLGGR